ncbi:MAG: LysR family transcriptional regulator [Pseudomonadales bacterium]|nr:LysR family transcriptional regulator [Pseudomonadales bacterium]
MALVELRLLRTLVALRDTGSLVEAAERVNLTQSALSHQMKDLEDRLGSPLFVRKTRPVRFTGAGRRLLALADRVLPEIRAAEQDLKRLAGGEAGRLFMAIECHSCFDWLLPAIEAFRDTWPDVELDLSSAFSFEPLPALARGDLDLVITSDPLDIVGLTYLPLFRYEAVLAVAPDHALARGRRVDPEALADDVLISYPVDRDRLDVFTRFLDPAGVAPRRVRTAELTPMIVQLVASGRGVACLPNWALTEYVERGVVRTLSLGRDGLWPVLHAAVRTDQADAAFMQSFVEVAAETCFRRLVGIRPAPRDPELRATTAGL